MPHILYADSPGCGWSLVIMVQLTVWICIAV